MPPLVASVVYLGLAVWLFWLDRDPKARTSSALWIPVAWLWIAGSRMVSEWLTALGWMSPDTTADLYLQGSALDRNLLTFLLVLGVAVMIRRGQLRSMVRANVPLALFLAYAAASIIWSDFPFVTLKRWFKAAGDVVMVMVVLTDPDRKAAVKRLLIWTGFVLVVHSVLLIKYYPALGRSMDPWTWTASFTGVTTHKNLMGQVGLVFGLAFVWRLLSAYHSRNGPERTRRLLAHGVALGLVLWIFRLVDSLTALSSFLFAGVFLFVAARRSFARSRRAVHWMVAATVAVVFATTCLGAGGFLFQLLGRDATLTGRKQIWTRVLEQRGNALVGTGFESYWLGPRLETLRRSHAGLNEAHNGYLEVYVTLGWVGVVLLGYLIARGYRDIVSAMRRNEGLAALRMAYFIAAIVSSFTEAGFRMFSLSWITFLLAVMAVPAETSPARVRSRRTSARWRWSSQARLRPRDRVAALQNSYGTLP